jgi:hypothetical protein
MAARYRASAMASRGLRVGRVCGNDCDIFAGYV